MSARGGNCRDPGQVGLELTLGENVTLKTNASGVKLTLLSFHKYPVFEALLENLTVSEQDNLKRLLNGSLAPGLNQCCSHRDGEEDGSAHVTY